MACSRHIDALTDAAAGAAPATEFAAHLAACATCRAQLAALRDTLGVADQQLAQLATAEPSARFMPRLRAALAGSGSVPARRAGWLWPACAAAAAVVMAVVLTITHQPAHQPTRQAVAAIGTPATPSSPMHQAPEPVSPPAIANPTRNRMTLPATRRAAGHHAWSEPKHWCRPANPARCCNWPR